jgi:hypothetical protein
MIWGNSLFNSKGQKNQLWIKQQAGCVFVEARYLHLSGVVAVERQGRHRFHKKGCNTFASSLLGDNDITDTANSTGFSPIEISKANDTVLCFDDRRIESLSDSARQLSFSQWVSSLRKHIKQFPSVENAKSYQARWPWLRIVENDANLDNPVARELAPAGWRSRPKVLFPEKTGSMVYDGYAAEREQAPSPRSTF